MKKFSYLSFNRILLTCPPLLIRCDQLIPKQILHPKLPFLYSKVLFWVCPILQYLYNIIPSGSLLDSKAFKVKIIWRECVGIEPTSDLLEPVTGFEVQGAHQWPIHSQGLFYQCLASIAIESKLGILAKL